MVFDSIEGAYGDDPARSDGVPFDLHWVEAGNEILLCLEGELDLVTAKWFLAQLDGRFAGRPDVEVRLDLSRLAFMDVAGGRTLAKLRDLVAAADGRLMVIGLDERRLPVARVLGLSDYLNGGRN
jgi:anti-anti-sigma factor